MNRTRVLRTSVAGATALLLVGGVALAAQAPHHSGNGTNGTGTHRGGHGGGPHDGPGGGVHFLHATGVVKTKTGTETDAVQEGSVTAVSATSITVKSSDDYSATYVIASTTKTHGTPTVGGRVSVVALVSGGTSTAKVIDAHQAPKPKLSASASPSA